MSAPRSRFALGAAALLVALALAFAPHLDNGYTLDDHYQVERNPHLLPTASWMSPFHEGVWQFLAEQGVYKSYYRPLMFVGFRVAYVVGGGEPWAFHLLSLLLHVLCVALVYLAFRALSVPRELASAASAMFALHPLAGETVYWIASLQELIALGGMLGSLVLMSLAWCRQGSARVALVLAATLAAVLGMLGKEIGVIAGPLLVAAALRGSSRATVASRIAWTAPVWLVTLGFLILRHAVVGGIGVATGDRPALLWSLGRAGRALLWYARRLLWPFPLSPVHPFPLEPGVTPSDYAGIGFLLVIALVVAVVLLRFRPALVWITWFGLPLMPPLLHYFAGDHLASGVVVAERHLYYSLGPFCLGLAWLGRRLFPAPLRVPALLAACILGGISVHAHGPTFHDDFAYFARARRTAPTSPFVLGQLGAEHLRRGEVGAAEELLRAAIAGSPLIAEPYLNLGTILLERGDAASAAPILRQGVELVPKVAAARLLLGRALLASGRAVEAIAELTLAAEAADPGEALLLLGAAQLETGAVAATVATWEKLLAAQPNHARALYNLSRLYLAAGELAHTRDLLERFVAVAHDPSLAAPRTEAEAWLRANR